MIFTDKVLSEYIMLQRFILFGFYALTQSPLHLGNNVTLVCEICEIHFGLSLFYRLQPYFATPFSIATIPI
jgi:hypothetical protein